MKYFFSIRFERCLSLIEIVRKVKEVLWYFTILWQCILLVSENANCLESRKHCEAIMDDLLLCTPSMQSHMRKLEDLLQALLKNGLKISPQKCQLFRKELQYMGNTIFIQEKRVCVKPLHSRLEAIQKLKPPTTVKGCRSFVGMVNFLSIFCQDLQKTSKTYL